MVEILEKIVSENDLKEVVISSSKAWTSAWIWACTSAWAWAACSSGDGKGEEADSRLRTDARFGGVVISIDN